MARKIAGKTRAARTRCRQPSSKPGSEAGDKVASTSTGVSGAYSLKLWFDGHGAHVFDVENDAVPFLWDAVQKPEGWMVFDAITHRVAVNKKHLLCSQFLVDYGFVGVMVDRDDMCAVDLYYEGQTEPISFGFEYEPGMKREKGSDDADNCPLQQMFEKLRGYENDEMSDRAVGTFPDVDNESVFFPLKHVCMIRVPLQAWGQGPDPDKLEPGEDFPIADEYPNDVGEPPF
ncbi:MAG TPA: hypothetical protein VG456_17850 [Candidatus Sulfopaludibacter sp.]|jgi:hypothetical protein|nr:hypothetical protein [Candidatus Sulfopaludibacter sp.]